MSQVYIFVTETALQKTKLNAVCVGFVDALRRGLTPAQIWEQYTQNPTLVVDQELTQYTALLEKSKVIVPQIQKKEDFKEFFASLYSGHTETTYCILGDLTELDESTQEGMLKILEEPPANIIFVLYAYDTSLVKPTIRSRSHMISIPILIVTQLLDPVILENIKKQFPDYKAACTDMLKSSEGLIRSIDTKKVERTEIDVWLWQIQYFASVLYAQNKLDLEWLALIQKHVALAVKNNRMLLQKRFVLETLIIS